MSTDATHLGVKHPDANLRHSIRHELLNSNIEAIAVASVITPHEISKRMGIDQIAAQHVHEAAKRHLRDLWAFQESAGER